MRAQRIDLAKENNGVSVLQVAASELGTILLAVVEYVRELDVLSHACVMLTRDAHNDYTSTDVYLRPGKGGDMSRLIKTYSPLNGDSMSGIYLYVHTVWCAGVN